jgi:UDP-glucose 4-epimerase
LTEFWKDKTVLVTGGDGYTGVHLCRSLLDAGAHVRALVRSGAQRNLTDLLGRLELARGDLTDYSSLLVAAKGADVIFHTAAITLIPETRAMVLNTFDVNSSGTLNAMLAAHENKVPRVVYTSTCHVYGNQSEFPITERHVPNPIDIYAASKLSGEHICTAFHEMFDLGVVIVRAFNHFGPCQREEFLIPTVITKLLGGEVSLGNPSPTRDYSYVSDIVDGYMLLAERGDPGELYHLSSGVERSVRQIVDDILRVGNFSAKVTWNPGARKIDIPRSVGDSSRARNLGWKPSVSFDEGIRNTIDWFRRRA